MQEDLVIEKDFQAECWNEEDIYVRKLKLTVKNDRIYTQLQAAGVLPRFLVSVGSGKSKNRI